jgi:hypothetical protein
MSTTQALNVEMQVNIPQDVFFTVANDQSLFKFAYDGYTAFSNSTLPLKRCGNPLIRPGSFVEFELENLATILKGLTVQVDYITDLPDDVINVTPGYEAFGVIELLSNKMPVLATTGKFKAIEQYIKYGNEEQKVHKMLVEQPQVLTTDPQLQPAVTEVTVGSGIDAKTYPVRRILLPLGLFFDDCQTPLPMDSIRSSKMTLRLQLNPNVPYYRAERDDAFEAARLLDKNGNEVKKDTTNYYTNADTYKPLIKQFVDVQVFGDYVQLCEQEAIVISRPSRIILYDDIIAIPEISIKRPQLTTGQTWPDISITTELDDLSNNITCILWVLTAEGVSVRTANYTTDVENKQCKSAQILFNGRPRLPEARPGHEFTQAQRRAFGRTVPYHLHANAAGEVSQHEADTGKNIMSALHVYSWSLDIFSKQLNGVAYGNAYKIDLITTWSFSNPGTQDADTQNNILQIYGIKKRVFGISNGQAHPLDTPLS